MNMIGILFLLLQIALFYVKVFKGIYGVPFLSVWMDTRRPSRSYPVMVL